MKKLNLKKLVVFSSVMIIILVITVLTSINFTNKKMTEISFQQLNELSDDFAKDVQKSIETNRAVLNSMALAISMADLSDTEMLTDILNNYNNIEQEYIKVRLLTADEMLLEQDGNWTNVSENVNFEKETQKAPYLSGRCTDFVDTDLYVMNQAMPVVRDGKTIAILYTSMLLQEISHTYNVNGFEGNAFALLIDGVTGEVLLDTWHESLGNLLDYTDREYKEGETILESLVKMQNDENGNLAFISKTRGTMIHLHYEPVGENNLSAVIGVKEEVAFENTKEIVNNLYIMSIIIFVVLLTLMLTISVFLFRANRSVYQMGISDKLTGLLNRSAYEMYLSENSKSVFDSIACVYIDVNGLHNINNSSGYTAGDVMLHSVAEALRIQWPDSKIYRIDGDEFVVFLENTDDTVCYNGIQLLKNSMDEQNCNISIGFSHRDNEIGLNRVVREADIDMLKNKADYYVINEKREIMNNK